MLDDAASLLREWNVIVKACLNRTAQKINMLKKKASVGGKSDQSLILPVIEQCIYVIRGQRVMLDSDLAQLYGVLTKNLNKAVQRNIERFPNDFMFQLNDKEFTALRFQIGTANKRGGRRTAPYVFTEHGAIMAANILRSDEAVKMSVFVVRAFVKLRELVSTNRQLAAKLDELESRIDKHDQSLVPIVAAIQGLLEIPEESKKKKRKIGYIS